MEIQEILKDAAGRPVFAARQVLDGIDDETLHAMPSGGSSIAWLLWHAARQADVQTAMLAEGPQLWETSNWGERMGVDRGPDAMGFGDTQDDVAALRITNAVALCDYVAATFDALNTYVETLESADYDEIIDESYTPPTTRGVRIVSIIDDAIAHIAQAAYVRGIVGGWKIGY